MTCTPYVGHVVRHAEFPGEWHLTRGYVQWPRVYLTYCGAEIPLLTSAMGEVLPVGFPDTGPLPNCDECVRRHLLAVQQTA